MVDKAVAELTDQTSVLVLARDLENLAAQTYVEAGGVFTTPELRKTGMSIGETEARHITVLNIALGYAPVPLPLLPTSQGDRPQGLRQLTLRPIRRTRTAPLPSGAVPRPGCRGCPVVRASAHDHGAAAEEPVGAGADVEAVRADLTGSRRCRDGGGEPVDRTLAREDGTDVGTVVVGASRVVSTPSTMRFTVIDDDVSGSIAHPLDRDRAR